MGRRKKESKGLFIRKPEDVERDMLGMSRDFALAHLVNADFTEWSALQRKIFTIILGEINWKQKGNLNIIEMKNEDIANKLGWELNKNDRRLQEVLKENLVFMIEHSYISLHNPITNELISAHLIATLKTTSYMTSVTLNPDFMPHFEDLYNINLETRKSFITFMEPDILSFSSCFAYPLFFELRSCGKSGGAVNTHTLTTRRLKEIFGLDESSYMRKDGHFDRTNFEKYVLLPAIEDINSSETLSILPCEDEKFFKKEKVKGKVFGYTFKFQIWDKAKITKNRQLLLEQNSLSLSEKELESLQQLTSNETDCFVNE